LNYERRHDKVFIELLTVAAHCLRAAHALMLGQIFQRLYAAFAGVEGLNTRPLDDHTRHIFTHGGPPLQRKKTQKPA
jgi:hypothetical protein